MGKLAQQLGGQSQVKVFKSGGAVLKEGSKKEEARDKKGLKTGGKATASKGVAGFKKSGNDLDMYPGPKKEGLNLKKGGSAK